MHERHCTDCKTPDNSMVRQNVQRLASRCMGRKGAVHPAHVRNCKVQLTIVVFHQHPLDSTNSNAFLFFSSGAGHITVLVLSGNLLHTKMVITMLTMHGTIKTLLTGRGWIRHLKPQMRLDRLVFPNRTKYMLLKMASGLIGQLVIDQPCARRKNTFEVDSEWCFVGFQVLAELFVCECVISRCFDDAQAHIVISPFHRYVGSLHDNGQESHDGTSFANRKFHSQDHPI